MNIPRPEHPNPQWERKSWQNLNGEWEFEFDFSCSAMLRNVINKEKLDRTITVPFCPESRLSGIDHIDFIEGVVYRRKFDITEDKLSGRVILHFGAVDYQTKVFINKKLVGEHLGGYTSFEFDITKYLVAGENEVFLAVEDHLRGKKQGAGKQSLYSYEPKGTNYRRTTGIWQTVWLEFVPTDYIKSAKYYTDINNSILTITGETIGKGDICAHIEYEGKTIADATIKHSGGFFSMPIKLDELHLWEVGKGGLYDLTLTFNQDEVKSYFGMRETKIEGDKFMLNGKSVFQRLVLDQGFYPDGVYTAPSEEDMIKDIEISLAAGFNGARLHEKVFEPRFLYHCDRLGYLAWAEYADWKMDKRNPLATERVSNEWQEAINRDFNHPAIIGWCPLNESLWYKEWEEENNHITSIYKLTKQLDPTRPCVDVGGFFHILPEVFDIHDYDQNPVTLKERWDTFFALREEGDEQKMLEFSKLKENEGSLKGQPYVGGAIFISECGGIAWSHDGREGWGYGRPETVEQFVGIYEGIVSTIMANKNIFGFCYTQLYDIEQEINGLYTFERIPKFDMNIFKKINSQKAAIED